MSTRKDRGLCSSCNSPPRPGRTLCASCASLASARTQARRAAGQCVQGGCKNQTFGASRCPSCAARHRRYAALARARKRRQVMINEIVERSRDRGIVGARANRG